MDRITIVVVDHGAMYPPRCDLRDLSLNMGRRGEFLVGPHAFPGSTYKIPHQRWGLVPFPMWFAKSLTKHGQRASLRNIIENFCTWQKFGRNMCKYGQIPQFSCAHYDWGFWKQVLDQLAKTAAMFNFQWTLKNSYRKNARCQNPSATVRIFIVWPRKKQPGSSSKKTPQVSRGEKDLIWPALPVAY